MARTNIERDRLSIDIFPGVHRKIKAYAAIHGQTIREYVLESIQERLKREKEDKELLVLTRHLDQDPILKELWDNSKDAAYDRLVKEKACLNNKHP